MKKLISSSDINKKVSLIAKGLNKITSEDIVMVGILNGSFMFFSDLIKKISLDCEVAFIKAKSYQNNERGILKIDLLENNFEGKTVILVEDIIDTGVTLNNIMIELLKKGVEDIFVVSLLVREGSENLVDYYGFKVNDDKFLVGYGLDNNQKNRHLTDIYEL